MRKLESKPTGTGQSAGPRQQTAGTTKVTIREPELADVANVVNYDDGLWSPKTAADYCELQPVTILRAIRRNELGAFKLSQRLIRLRKQDVVAWLAKARIGFQPKEVS